MDSMKRYTLGWRDTAFGDAISRFRDTISKPSATSRGENLGSRRSGGGKSGPPEVW